MRLVLFLLVILVQATAASAQSWEARIAAAEAKEAEIVAWADGYGLDYSQMGSIMAYKDSREIECLVLAEVLGLGDITDHLSFMAPPPTANLELPDPSVVPDERTLYTLLDYANNLRVWARNAAVYHDGDHDHLSEVWELRCNGQGGIPEGLVPSTWDTRAAFHLNEGSLTILGDIEPGLFEAFAEVLEKNPVQAVFIGSRGGSVLDAMEIGGLIRAKDLDVYLTADCESACPLIYFAGKEPRTMSRKRPYRLGFHQISVDGEAIPLDSEIYDMIGAYVTAMGVDAWFVLAAMRSTPPDEMYFPGHAKYCEVGIVEWVIGICGRQPGLPGRDD